MVPTVSRAASFLLVACFFLPSTLFGQSTSRLRQLDAQLSSARQPRSAQLPDSQSAITARNRLHLLRQLARTNPTAARAAIYSREQSAAILNANPNLAGLIETPGQWIGTLEVTIEDDFANHQSRTHWLLHTSDDRRLELLFDHPSDRAKLLNRTASVSGMGLQDFISVDSLSVAVPTAQLSTPTCTTTGAQNTAVLIMNQKTGPAYPTGLDQSVYWSPQYFNSSPKAVNSFWQENSLGVTSNSGTIFGPFTLDKDYTCNDTDALATSAINIAKANGVDFSQFTRVSIIYPVSSCVFGGLGTIGCRSPDSQISHPYSVTWIPAFTSYTTGTDLWGLLSHELGHNLGLGHSNSLDFGTIPLGAIDYSDSVTASSTTAINKEYGDPYTVMGGGSYTCGGQYTAFNKNQYLAWLGSDSVTEVTSSGSFTLVPYELSSGTRGLRILRDALTGSWIWLEYRQALGTYDAAFNTCESGSNILQGALGYYESLNSSDGHLYLLDFNPTSAPNNFANSALLPGHTWSDPYSLLTLSVISADANGLSVSATYDQPCAALSLSAPIFAASGASGTVTVTAPANCSWQASTAASWITFTGTTSGTGNAVIPFTIATNANHDQRNSYITVQRQSLPIVQKGTGTFISALNPSFQSGNSGTINFSFEDPLGTNDIDNLQIYFQDYTSCEVYMDQNATHNIFFFLYDGDSGTFTSSLTPGQNATISNSKCSLSGVGTSVTRVGNQLKLALNMSFTSGFMGAHRVTAVVADSTGTSVETPVGTWQVQPAASVTSITPNSGRQGLIVPIVIAGLNTHFSNASTVTVSGTGVTSSAISATFATQLNATLTISADATLGAHTVTVTTGTEVVTTTFTVSGNGIASLSPTSLTFAPQDVGTTSAAQTIVLTNTGNAALNLSSITVSGEFGLVHNCGSSLSVGAQCNINVTFQPLNYGLRTGSLSVTDDGLNTPHTAALTGTAQIHIIPTRPPRTTRPTPPSTPVVITSQTAPVPITVTTPVVNTLRTARTTTCSASGNIACSIDRDGRSRQRLKLPVKVQRKLRSEHTAE